MLYSFSHVGGPCFAVFGARPKPPRRISNPSDRRVLDHDADVPTLHHGSEAVGGQEAAIVDAQRFSDPVEIGLHAVWEVDPIATPGGRLEGDVNADVAIRGKMHRAGRARGYSSPVAVLL